MKGFLISILVIFSTLHIYAATINPDIEAANKAYAKEKYNDAIQLYTKVLDKGLESYELYYNLGNCYFRISNFPMAILNYERGKKLNPADEDLDFNLKIANTKIVDKIDPIPQLFFVKWWLMLTNLFSFDYWAYIAIGSISFFFIFLFLYLASSTYKMKKLSFWFSNSFLLITVLCIYFAYNQYSVINDKNSAIIFSANVTVKSSPDEKGSDKFVIHEGTKVILLDELNNWVKIKIANGSNGWIEKQTFEVI